MSYMVYTLLIWFLPEYPIKGLMRFYIYKFICKCFSWAKGRSYISIMFGFPFFFKKNGLGYQMPCGLLFGFQETETHSRARGGCHVSTFLGRGVTLSLILSAKIQIVSSLLAYQTLEAIARVSEPI